MLEIVPYVNFDGRCEEAFRFYQSCFGGEIVALMRHSDSPLANELPSDWLDRVLHARLVVGDWQLMGSDDPPTWHEPARGFHLSVGLSDPDEAESVFHALANGGRVTTPIEETDWALKFGMLVDRFGIPWMVNCPRR